jgi:glycopeptide antibiotics resistance protein
MRWFYAVILGLYLVFVARLTLADASVGRSVFSWANASATRLSGGELAWSETEVLANIALFVPVGLLLALVLRRATLAAVLCLVMSAGIELAQQRYFPTRVPSIADVEHNALGGVIGAALALPFLAVSTVRARARSGHVQ